MSLELRMQQSSYRNEPDGSPKEDPYTLDPIRLKTMHLDRPLTLKVVQRYDTPRGQHTVAEVQIFAPEGERSGPIVSSGPTVYIPREPINYSPSDKTMSLPEGTRLEEVTGEENWQGYIARNHQFYMPVTDFDITTFTARRRTMKDDLTKEAVDDVFGFGSFVRWLQGDYWFLYVCPCFIMHGKTGDQLEKKFRRNLGTSLTEYLNENRGEFNILSEKSSWPWYAQTVVDFGGVNDETTKAFRRYVVSGILEQGLQREDVEAWAERSGRTVPKEHHGRRIRYLLGKVMEETTGISMFGKRETEGRYGRKIGTKSIQNWNYCWKVERKKRKISGRQE